MAYRSTGTPRFYIDQYQYLKSSGFDFQGWYDQHGDGGFQEFPGTKATQRRPGEDPDLFGTFNFAEQKHVVSGAGTDYDQSWLYWVVPTGIERAYSLTSGNVGLYSAFMNHNARSLYGEDHRTWTRFAQFTTPLSETGLVVADQHNQYLKNHAVLNCQVPGNSSEAGHSQDGSTIAIHDTENRGYWTEPVGDVNVSHEMCKFLRIGFGYTAADTSGEGEINEIYIGGISYGFYYDMPHSPDLKLTMETEFDGYDSITTLGGSTLTRQRYLGSPYWYTHPDLGSLKREPFGVYPDYDQEAYAEVQYKDWGLKRNGRRIWNLKFSYIAGSDMFAANPMEGTYLEDSLNVNNEDLDSYNYSANYSKNHEFGRTVAANTSAPTDEQGWQTHRALGATDISAINTAIGGGHDCTTNMSSIGSGIATLKIQTEAEHNAIMDLHDASGWGTSIGTTDHNWSLRQPDVFDIRGFESITSRFNNMGFEDDGALVSSGAISGWISGNTAIDTGDEDGDGNTSELKYGVGTTIVYRNGSNDTDGYACRIKPIASAPYVYAGISQNMSSGSFIRGRRYRIYFDITNYTSGEICLESADENGSNVSLQPMATTYNSFSGERLPWGTGRFYVEWVSCDKTGLVIKRAGTASDPDGSECDITIDNIVIYEGAQDAAINRLKDVYYKCRFRVKQTNLVTDDDQLQLGCGYYRFFQEKVPLDTYTTYEVIFRVGDMYDGSYHTKGITNQNSHFLTIGGYASGGAFGAQWEFDWLTVERANPQDFSSNINTDESFEAMVLNKIGNGDRFIFQPDNTANNPGDFAICVLAQDSLKVTQVAHNTYNCAMKIKEVW